MYAQYRTRTRLAGRSFHGRYSWRCVNERSKPGSGSINGEARWLVLASGPAGELIAAPTSCKCIDSMYVCSSSRIPRTDCGWYDMYGLEGGPTPRSSSATGTTLSTQQAKPERTPRADKRPMRSKPGARARRRARSQGHAPVEKKKQSRPYSHRCFLERPQPW